MTGRYEPVKARCGLTAIPSTIAQTRQAITRAIDTIPDPKASWVQLFCVSIASNMCALNREIGLKLNSPCTRRSEYRVTCYQRRYTVQWRPTGARAARDDRV
jgi:hypothetical protein